MKLLQVNLKIKSIDKPVGSTSRRCPDNRKIRSLGYEQEFSLQEGLKKTIEYYENNVGGTISLLSAMQLTGVKKLLFSRHCCFSSNWNYFIFNNFFY